MNRKNRPLSCKEVNSKDMVDYLFRLGFEPIRISGRHYWYLSPLRKERTASFKVNRLMNCWYDFGDGRGGSLVDFGIFYFKCSVSEFLYRFKSHFSSDQIQTPKGKNEQTGSEEPIQIKKVKCIDSPALLSYLKERKIDTEAARKFCQEVSFEMRGKTYYAIGCKNDSHGYELRNEFFKGSNQPKDITTINNKSESLSIFEGFFDFLSYQTICINWEEVSQDFIILNSLSFLKKVEPLLSTYKAVNLFLDQDRSGQKGTRRLLSLGSHINDKSCLYQHYKDFNDWLMHFGLPRSSLIKGKCSTQ